jgi:hypothetical protein
MYTGEISISAENGYDRDYSFDITIRKGDFSIHTNLWDEPQAFERFGEKLTTFPRSLTDTVELQVGAIRSSPGQDYLFLKAYCYDANGHTALKVVMHINKPEPHEQMIEFSIPAEVVALNKLGRMLQTWPLKTKVEINWRAQVS